MLTVVVLAIALVSVFNAFSAANRARQMQQENLRRVIATLSEANFALTEPILRQMSGLSGTEFSLFDKGYRLQASSMPLGAAEWKYLQQKSFENVPDGPPRVILKGQTYLSRRITMKDRPPFAPAAGSWYCIPRRIGRRTCGRRLIRQS